MVDLINLARMTVASAPGTGGSVALSAAVPGFLTFDLAGAVDGKTYRYAIRDGLARELSSGVYTASTKTLTRTVLKSTNSDAAINATSAAIVSGVVAAEDIIRPEYYEFTGTGASATVTISQATPGIVTDAAHGMSIAQVVNYTNSGGALPSPLVAGTSYYVSSQNYTSGQYSLSTSVDNALAGVSIATTTAGSGTHTRINAGNLTSVTNLDVAGLTLPAGTWEVSINVRYVFAASTTVNSITSLANTVSATLASSNLEMAQFSFGGLAVNGPAHLQSTRRITLASPGNVYAIARANFAASTAIALGKLAAKRVAY